MFTITSADVARCPEQRLDVPHYRKDGTCMHHAPQGWRYATPDEVERVLAHGSPIGYRLDEKGDVIVRDTGAQA